MRNLLKLEEAVMFIFGFALLLQFALPWWLLLIIFFTPDLGAIGYLVNPRVGAVTYNILHHKAVALTLFFLGVAFSNSYLQMTGLIIFAHSSFDRVLGFGLKYPDSFNSTHLGAIGEASRVK